MKRNPKPFAVEIKKSRVPGQPHHLLPRRLFEPAPAAATKIVSSEGPQAVATAEATAAPSIVEPVWSNLKPAEPIRRKRSSEVKPKDGQIALDLHGVITEAVTGGPERAIRLEVSPVRENIMHVERDPQQSRCARIGNCLTGVPSRLAA
jgi:hypothetical protein